LTERKPFEFDAERYRSCSKHQKEWGGKVIGELGLTGDERILDIGCGDGVLTSKIAELVPRGSVLGIDSSKNMIDAANRLQKDNLHFMVLDANDIDFDDEFDVIFSNAALHWVSDHGRLHANCHRALRAGGQVRFTFAGDGNCTNFFAVMRKLMNDDHYQNLFDDFQWPWYMPSVASYEDLVRDTGYSSFEVWGEIADRHFTKDEMIGWIEQPSIVPFLQHIPPSEHKKFSDCAVQIMLERTIEPEGTYFETFRRIHMSGTK